MMGETDVLQESLFYSSNLDRHVPMNHLLRSVDRFVDRPASANTSSLTTAISVGPRSIQS